MTLPKKVLFLPIISIFCLHGFSQTIQPNDHSRLSKSTTDLTLDDPSSAQTRDSISYDKVIGSPFWPEKNKLAQLFSDNRYITKAYVRINLATGELYFLQDTSELVLEDQDINKVVFNDDKTVLIRNFPGLYLNQKQLKDFVQVMNNGNYQLLKYTKRKINAPESASKLEKKFSFIDVTTYFLVANGKSQNLRRLDKEPIFFLVPSSLRDEDWIKLNNLNLKNEKDVILFLNHINGL